MKWVSIDSLKDPLSNETNLIDISYYSETFIGNTAPKIGQILKKYFSSVFVAQLTDNQHFFICTLLEDKPRWSLAKMRRKFLLLL